MKPPVKKFQLLKDAPKNIALGVFEFGKEIVTLGKDAVVGSFNFGKNLRKRLISRLGVLV